MSTNEKQDLEEVKREFEKFRSERRGKERIPEKLWADAVGLLADYPINVVWRELQIKPEYLKARARLTTNDQVHKSKDKSAKSSKFLSLKASQLAAITNAAQQNSPSNKIATSVIKVPLYEGQNAECRLTIERVDGRRLQLTLPIDWPHIQELCNNFLRG